MTAAAYCSPAISSTRRSRRSASDCASCSSGTISPRGSRCRGSRSNARRGCGGHRVRYGGPLRFRSAPSHNSRGTFLCRTIPRARSRAAEPRAAPHRGNPAMQLGLNENQELLQRTFAELFAAESSPERVRAAEATGFDPGLWKHLIETGAIGIRVPETLGGSGAGLHDAAVLAEQAGRALASAPLAEAIC